MIEEGEISVVLSYNQRDILLKALVVYIDILNDFKKETSEATFLLELLDA